MNSKNSDNFYDDISFYFLPKKEEKHECFSFMIRNIKLSTLLEKKIAYISASIFKKPGITYNIQPKYRKTEAVTEGVL